MVKQSKLMWKIVSALLVAVLLVSASMLMTLTLPEVLNQTALAVEGDMDDDGVPDEDDNCPEVYNPTQYDFNENEVGDACEEIILYKEEEILFVPFGEGERETIVLRGEAGLNFTESIESLDDDGDGLMEVVTDGGFEVLAGYSTNLGDVTLGGYGPIIYEEKFEGMGFPADAIFSKELIFWSEVYGTLLLVHGGGVEPPPEPPPFFKDEVGIIKRFPPLYGDPLCWRGSPEPEAEDPLFPWHEPIAVYTGVEPIILGWIFLNCDEFWWDEYYGGDTAPPKPEYEFPESLPEEKYFTDMEMKLVMGVPEDSGPEDTFKLTGTTTISGEKVDTGPTDPIATEIVSMDLSGDSAFGEVKAKFEPGSEPFDGVVYQMFEAPDFSAAAENIGPIFPAESFFDVFVEIEVDINDDQEPETLYPYTPDFGPGIHFYSHSCIKEFPWWWSAHCWQEGFVTEFFPELPPILLFEEMVNGDPIGDPVAYIESICHEIVPKDDTDEDWIPDEEDNCPEDYNPGQEDSEGEGEPPDCNGGCVEVEYNGGIILMDALPRQCDPLCDGNDCEQCSEEYWQCEGTDCTNGDVFAICEAHNGTVPNFEESLAWNTEYGCPINDSMDVIYSPDGEELAFHDNPCCTCDEPLNPEDILHTSGDGGVVCVYDGPDGVGDVCDNCPYLYNPDQEPDQDCDGYLDDEDNCPEDYNPGQEDSDVGEKRLTFSVDTSDQPEPAVDSNGNVHVVYSEKKCEYYCEGNPACIEECEEDHGDDEWELMYMMLDNNGNTLIDATQITEYDVLGSRRPQVAVDTTNHVHVVWQDKRFDEGGHSTDVYYKKLNPFADDRNGDSADPVSITLVDDKLISDTIDSHDKYKTPQIAIDQEGNIHVVYETEGVESVYYQKLNNSGNRLIAETQVSEGDTDRATPDVTVDSDNNPHIAWNEEVECAKEILYGVLDGSSGDDETPADFLIEPTLVTDADCENSKRQSISIDTSGNVYIIWTDKRGDEGEVYFTKLDPDTDGGTVATLIDDMPLTEDDDKRSHLPTHVIDSANNLHLTWFEGGGEGGNAHIYYTKLNSSGNRIIDDIKIISSVTAGSESRWTQAFLDTDSSNFAHIVWADNRHRGEASHNLEIYYWKMPDGVGDVCDNCVRFYNPSQSDSDNNGRGDACDRPQEEDGRTRSAGGGGGSSIVPKPAAGDGAPDEGCPANDHIGHWAEEYIEKWCLMDESILFDDNTYRPNIPVSRLEFLMRTMDLFGQDVMASDEAAFMDVENDPGRPYADTGFNEGLVTGYPDGLYYPDENILRKDAIKILLHKLSVVAGIELDDGAVSELGDVIEDVWYYVYIATAQKLGIVEGYVLEKIFGVNDPLLRSEMAKILMIARDL